MGHSLLYMPPSVANNTNNCTWHSILVQNTNTTNVHCPIIVNQTEYEVKH